MRTASTTAQAKKLKNFFLEKAKSCIHQPKGLLKYRFVTPSYDVVAGADDTSEVSDRSTTGHYLQMYDWDACFFSQASVKAGIEGLSQEIVANFLSLQEGDGHIPRTVSPSRIWDNGDQCKPFSARLFSFGSRTNARAAVTTVAIWKVWIISSILIRTANMKAACTLAQRFESGVDDNLALLIPWKQPKVRTRISLTS